MSDDWPAAVGNNVEFVLPARGVSKEERLQRQLRILHEEHEEKMEESQQRVSTLEEQLNALRKDFDIANIKCKTEETERARLSQENVRLTTAFEDLRRTSTEIEEDCKDKIAFYREYIQRIDSLTEDGKTEESTGKVVELKSEFEKKEVEMTVGILTKQNNKLKAELAGREAPEGELAELMDQNVKLGEELEQLESHCMAQQQLRRDAQAEVTRLTGERDGLKGRLEKEFDTKLQDVENKLSDAALRESTLQSELASAQRRGLAAQRQLDEVRSENAENNPTSPGSLTSSFNGQINALQSSLERTEAERVSLSTRLQETLQQLNEQRVKTREVESEREKISTQQNAQHHTTTEYLALQEKHAATETQLANIKTLLDVKIGELASLKAKLAELESSKTQLNGLQQQLSDVREQLNRAVSDSEKKRTEAAQHESRVEILEGDVLELQLKYERETSKCMAVITQLDITKSEKASLAASLSEAKIAVEEAEKLGEGLRDTIVKGEKEVKIVGEKLGEAEKDGEWLQGEIVKARRAEKKWKEKVGRREDEVSTLEGEVKSLKKELRLAKSQSVGVPLPDHANLPPTHIAELVRGGLDSWAKILSNLESFSTATPTTEDECVFITALSSKVSAMLEQMKDAPTYPPLSATAGELSQRTKIVLNRF